MDGTVIVRKRTIEYKRWQIGGPETSVFPVTASETVFGNQCIGGLLPGNIENIIKGKQVDLILSLQISNQDSKYKNDYYFPHNRNIFGLILLIMP